MDARHGSILVSHGRRGLIFPWLYLVRGLEKTTARTVVRLSTVCRQGRAGREEARSFRPSLARLRRNEMRHLGRPLGMEAEHRVLQYAIGIGNTLVLAQMFQ